MDANRPEFIPKAPNCWACKNDVTLDYSRPGKPSDNAFVKSFNGRLRGKCLITHRFLPINEGAAIARDPLFFDYAGPGAISDDVYTYAASAKDKLGDIVSYVYLGGAGIASDTSSASTGERPYPGSKASVLPATRTRCSRAFPATARRSLRRRSRTDRTTTRATTRTLTRFLA